ncbi:hypothetical protein ACR76H_21940 [Bacteroides kribbi]
MRTREKGRNGYRKGRKRRTTGNAADRPEIRRRWDKTREFCA